MTGLLRRLLLALAVVVLVSQVALAETYFRPSLNLKNTVDHVWPKCFYKYLTTEFGYATERWNMSLELNWLDYVDVLTAYRIGFPYVLKGTWAPTDQDRLELSLLTLNSANAVLKPADMAEARYARSLAGPAGAKLEVSAALRAFPGEKTISLTPGIALSKQVRKAEVVLALNALDAKDYATLGRDRNVLSLGATWAMYGDSRLAATLNTVLGPADPTIAGPGGLTVTRTWLDLRFQFGSLYRHP
ncbi:MAG: hypothetical protein ACM3XZ_05880 [Betaproteobacteria bacterium]